MGQRSRQRQRAPREYKLQPHPTFKADIGEENSVKQDPILYLQQTLGNHAVQRYLDKTDGKVQRKMGDGHDLTSPRFAGNSTLEAAYDHETLVSRVQNHTGDPVRLIQESLLQLGYQLPEHGADGIFGSETDKAIRQFQEDHAAKIDGIVGPETMGLLDKADTAPGTKPPGTEPPGTEPPGTEPPKTEPPGTEPPEVTPKSKALQMVDQFEADTSSPQAFPKLSKSEIIKGLRQRIENPEVINQSGLSVCGPASTMYILASGNPEGFAHVTINLFKFGEVTLNEYSIEPCDDLKENSPDTFDGQWGEGNKPSQIDWMVLSSLRDSENAIWDYEGGPDEAFSAITMPGEVEEWLEDMLGFKNIEDETNLIFTKGVEHALETANGYFAAGAYVVMLINANMLTSPGTTKKDRKETKKKAADGLPNHWVVLKGPIVRIDNIMKVPVYSWGELKDYYCTVDVFDENYYGAVFAY
ncbi:MAG: peptidoglycan-binding protein [Chloroflexi bacterium]|nr:peptidoglycan-binding protein [Chloroflexota bacterium]